MHFKSLSCCALILEYNSFSSIVLFFFLFLKSHYFTGLNLLSAYHVVFVPGIIYLLTIMNQLYEK